MPPAPSRVSDQFSIVASTGRSSMVICNHCRTQKIPKNSLHRKEEHLRHCEAFALSPLATETDINGETLLETSISRRAQRTKPGNMKPENKELHRIQSILSLHGGNGSGAGSMALQERVEKILRGEAATPRLNNNSGTSADSVYSNLPINSFTPSPYGIEVPATGGSDSLATLLQSVNNGTASNINPRKRPAQDPISPSLPPGNTDRTPSATPGCAVTPASMQPLQLDNNSGNKRLKYAELYLDEEDFEFACSAQTPREARYAALLERLARLVRLRDTR